MGAFQNSTESTVIHLHLNDTLVLNDFKILNLKFGFIRCVVPSYQSSLQPRRPNTTMAMYPREYIIDSNLVSGVLICGLSSFPGSDLLADHRNIYQNLEWRPEDRCLEHIEIGSVIIARNNHQSK